MAQLGGAKLGGPALSAGTMVPQDLRNLPPGAITALVLTVSLSLKSSGAAFALVINNTSAEAVDDSDLLMNAIFTQIALYWESGILAGVLTPAQWRTVLGFFNKHDYGGTLVNAASVPVSTGAATAFKLTITIPVALPKLFVDGRLFANGSHRLSTGQIQYFCGSTLIPSVVLANGTAAVSAVSVNVWAKTGVGSESDVGNLWKVERKGTLPTYYQHDDRDRLAMFDVTTVAANAVTAYNVGQKGMVDPTTLQADFQQETLPTGGFDPTQRCTPLIWPHPEKTLLDFQAEIGHGFKTEIVSGASGLTVYDITVIHPDAQAVENVAQKAGAGGPVTLAHPTPPSLPPGSGVPTGIAHWLPTRVTPGAAAPGPGSAHHAATPAQAGQTQNQRATAASRVASMFRNFRRR